jgi:hypothetical protein
MSLQSLNLNYPKAWENARVNNLQVDNKLILPRNLTPYAQVAPGTLNIIGNEKHFYISYTQGAAIAPGLVQSITVNNTSLLSSDDCVISSVYGFTGTWGTEGCPLVIVDTIGTGSFRVHVVNAGLAAIPLPAKTIIMEFLIINNS